MFNPYENAPRQPDFTIDQAWHIYSDEEHDRWDRLFQRSQYQLINQAAPEYLDALSHLELSHAGIPNMRRLSEKLMKRSGWQVVPVAGLVPDEIFFDHLAHRRFPAGAFIRDEEHFDYLQEPDIFHDIFGHVPMLADPSYAQFLESYGKAGSKAIQMHALPLLARLYWYTVEFGLIETKYGLRIFGAGILSSPAESQFSLEDPSPHRIGFDLARVMATDYAIDDFQKTYFVIESFEALKEACDADFTPLYKTLRAGCVFDPAIVQTSDRVLSLGTGHYFAA